MSRVAYILRFLLAASCIGATGCHCNKPAPPKQELLKRPAIDLTHGGGGFPLNTDKVPASTAELALSLNAAYKQRLEARQT